MRLHSLKLKIILSSAACILVVGLFSNIFLYRYFIGIVGEKADSIDRLNLDRVQLLLNHTLNNLYDLGSLCANDLEIARVMRHPHLETGLQKQEALRARETLGTYLAASGIQNYVDKLVAFSEDGENSFSVQAVTKVGYNTMLDPAKIRETGLFHTLGEDQRWAAGVGTSIVDGTECIVYMSSIYNYATSTYHGWLYIEMDTSWITEVIGPHEPGSLFVVDRTGALFPSNAYPSLPEGAFPLVPREAGEMVQEGTVYRLQAAPLQLAGMTLYSRSDISYLSQNGRPVVFTVLVVVISSLAVALLLSFALSSMITRPLRRLTARIQKIGGNDLDYDPEIERGKDEIAQTGRLVNEMSGSIRNLMQQTEEMYIQRKNTEIALLQSQVNPHFLYNTLDSIHWMATIQNNPGIAQVTKSLASLLRNLAKGVGDKISLGEELSLLGDYIDIQSVRYLEAFRVENRIAPAMHRYRVVKFTLQPLVENAIFHGIEPTGRDGTILLDAREEGDSLLIIVEDDGVGMTADEVARLMNREKNLIHSGLSGIGVANVDHRLKLLYGQRYGLTYQSEKGRGTRVTVRIPKETDGDATGEGALPAEGGD